MSYDATITSSLHVGEKTLLQVSVPAATGLLFTIQGTPTFTLKDSGGNVVFGPVNVTGNDTTQKAQPNVWYVLDTTSPNVLAAGVYVGVFAVSYQGNDSPTPLNRTEELVVQIALLGQVEIAGTYDITTTIGQVRMWIADTNTANLVFSDAELQYFLNYSSNIVLLAAANALEALAVDQGKLAIAIKMGMYSESQGNTAYDAIVERASKLRALAPVPPVVIAPDPVFTIGIQSDGSPGTMDIW